MRPSTEGTREREAARSNEGSSQIRSMKEIGLAILTVGRVAASQHLFIQFLPPPYIGSMNSHAIR